MTWGNQRTHLRFRQAGLGVADTLRGGVAVRLNDDRATIRPALFRQKIFTKIFGGAQEICPSQLREVKHET